MRAKLYWQGPMEEWKVSLDEMTRSLQTDLQMIADGLTPRKMNDINACVSISTGFGITYKGDSTPHQVSLALNLLLDDVTVHRTTVVWNSHLREWVVFGTESPARNLVTEFAEYINYTYIMAQR